MLILAFVHPPVCPLEAALSMHAVSFPLAFVFSAVSPFVNSKAVDVIVVKLALIDGALKIHRKR